MAGAIEPALTLITRNTSDFWLTPARSNTQSEARWGAWFIKSLEVISSLSYLISDYRLWHYCGDIIIPRSLINRKKYTQKNRMHLYFQSNGLTSRAKPMHIGRSIPVLCYLICFAHTHHLVWLTPSINLETPFDLSIHAFGLWEDPWPGFQPPSLTMSSKI